MSKQVITAAVIGAMAVAGLGAAMAYNAFDSKRYADVVNVTTVNRTLSVPRQECFDQVVEVQKPTKDPDQITGTVIGAVIGGVLGNQVGGGSGKKVATVAGAVAGGYAGNKVQEGIQENNGDIESQRQCTTVIDSRKEFVGYDVTYRLDGEEKVVRMNHKPGDRIAIENGQPVLD
ncbi:MAG: glycine zipper 2TM domain-containing protein [Xanthomonadales bacterium]|nr:glycine zipper 2TM domain-containing protein [Xanthomonadales bacterium]